MDRFIDVLGQRKADFDFHQAGVSQARCGGDASIKELDASQDLFTPMSDGFVGTELPNQSPFHNGQLMPARYRGRS
jgi:hypothetical protein